MGHFKLTYGNIQTWYFQNKALCLWKKKELKKEQSFKKLKFKISKV
jgi:hypothetical protein